MGTLASTSRPTDAPRWIEGGPLDGQIGPDDRDAFTEDGARYRLAGSVFVFEGFAVPSRAGDRPMRNQSTPPRGGTR